MKVFISWSGERSGRIGEVLRQWLPAVVQRIEPYYSVDDIAKGSRSMQELGAELEASRIGLICVTAENASAPWLAFEAGALSKSVDRARVCPLLFGDIKPTDIVGPLAQFQAARFSKKEVRRVVTMMNSELGDQSLAPGTLDLVFEKWWPDLETRVHAELSRAAERGKPERSERELLEELLTLVRSGARASGVPAMDEASVRRVCLRYLATVADYHSSDAAGLARSLGLLGRSILDFVPFVPYSPDTHEMFRQLKISTSALGMSIDLMRPVVSSAVPPDDPTDDTPPAEA